MRTLLTLFTIFITTNGGVVRLKPQPSYEDDQGVQSTNKWSAVGSSEQREAPLMQYDGSQSGNRESASEPKYLAPKQEYKGNYNFPVSSIEQQYRPTYFDHNGFDNHELSYLNHILTLKIKEATAEAEARAKEASEKEAILAKWKEEEAKLERELAEKQASFDAWMTKSLEEKGQKTVQKTKHTAKAAPIDPRWKPNYASNVEIRTSNVKKHSENTDNGSDLSTVIMLKGSGVGNKGHSYLSMPLQTKESNYDAVDNNPSQQAGNKNTIFLDNKQSYADVESKIALLKTRNDIASLTPSEASAESIKPYDGPLASIYVLPSGYLADTDEVFAAKQSHMRALAEAEVAVLQWQKSRVYRS